MIWDSITGVVSGAGADVEARYERFVLMEPIALQRLLSNRSTEHAAMDVTAGPAADMQKLGILKMQGRTAVISFVGLANKRLHGPPWYASYIATSAAVGAAAADKRVDSILLKIDSPGGYVSGLAEAADAIKAAAAIKPVVAQIDGLGASAAYWIASQATEIYAGRLDDVGSIGVIGVLYDVSKMFEEDGVKTEVFSTGKYKWTGVMGTALTDEQRDYLQQGVDDLGDAFVADVARGRRMAEADVRAVADGRVFNAQDALSKGLIDGVRTYADTVAVLDANARRRRGLVAARIDAARKMASLDKHV